MNFATLRRRMVQEQLARRGITDARVLEAMGRVPRERFLPPALAAQAYDDCPQPIGERQTISQPYMVALMTQRLELQGDERVLEIGTGSGYQAAVLAEIGCIVYSVERRAALAARAAALLAELGYDRVQVTVGDGTLGHVAAAPFDRIVVTAGAPEVPRALREQLAEDGTLVIPVGSRSSQELVVVRRRGQSYSEERGTSCVFVSLVGAQGWGAAEGS